MTTDEITVRIEADGVPVEATGATPEEAAAAAVEAYRQLTDEDSTDDLNVPDTGIDIDFDPWDRDTDPIVPLPDPPRPGDPDLPPTDPFGPYWGVDRTRPWQVDDSGGGDSDTTTTTADTANLHRLALEDRIRQYSIV